MVLDKELLKDAVVTQLLDRLLDILQLFLQFHQCFVSSEEALRFPEINGQIDRTGRIQ